VAGRVQFRSGSADSTGDRFDLVCANIQADILIAIARDLEARLADGGRLILAGFLLEQADAVRAAFAGLPLHDQLDEEGWRALVLSR
jgi:ribosomal protein L11 methyltransferase